MLDAQGGWQRPRPSLPTSGLLGLVTFPHRFRAPRANEQHLENQFRKGQLMAGRSKKKAETVFLVCEESGEYNYALRRKPGGEKLRLKKYSPRLRKHTWHTEKKK